MASLGVLAPCYLVPAAQTTAQYSVTAWGHKDGLPSTLIYAISQTNDGFLWLGTADGVVRFDGMQFTPWRSIQPNDAPLGQVHALCASRRGGLWFGTGAGTLGRISNDHLTTVSLHSAVESIEEARDGSLWVATSTELRHLQSCGISTGPTLRRSNRPWRCQVNGFPDRSKAMTKRIGLQRGRVYFTSERRTG